MKFTKALRADAFGEFKEVPVSLYTAFKIGGLYSGK